MGFSKNNGLLSKNVGLFSQRMWVFPGKVGIRYLFRKVFGTAIHFFHFLLINMEGEESFNAFHGAAISNIEPLRDMEKMNISDYSDIRLL